MDDRNVAPASKEFLYGLNPAFEALIAGKRRFYNAYITNGTRNSTRLNKLIRLLEERDIPIEFTDKGRLQQLCKSHEHQGVVLRSSTYPYEKWEDLYDCPRLLLLDNVEDPHNVGAILRSAEVFGFSTVLLPAKGVPEIYPSVVKVSAGAVEHMRITKQRSANQYVRKAQDDGYKILSLDAKGNTPMNALPDFSNEKVMLVIGGEDKGVGQFVLNISDHILAVNQFGKVNSLNASVAAGIAMYALSVS
ncbi:MAG: 23S rRNA (guanosine(2251)-2'-O)-methyltransferase RlmB [Opitutales bacterium]|nr:23S rRNA (guanosine(2251)-2'-O)-methyltransferase RlmB [Opitutales bacterium]